MNNIKCQDFVIVIQGQHIGSHGIIVGICRDTHEAYISLDNGKIIKVLAEWIEIIKSKNE